MSPSHRYSALQLCKGSLTRDAVPEESSIDDLDLWSDRRSFMTAHSLASQTTTWSQNSYIPPPHANRQSTRSHDSFSSSLGTLVDYNTSPLKRKHSVGRKPSVRFASVQNLKQQATEGLGYESQRSASVSRRGDRRTWRGLLRVGENNEMKAPSLRNNKRGSLASAVKAAASMRNTIGHLFSGASVVVAIRPSGEAQEQVVAPKHRDTSAISLPWNFQHTIHIDKDLSAIPLAWHAQLGIPCDPLVDEDIDLFNETDITAEPTLEAAVKRLRSWGIRSHVDESHLRHIQQVMEAGHCARGRVSRPPPPSYASVISLGDYYDT